MYRNVKGSKVFYNVLLPEVSVIKSQDKWNSNFDLSSDCQNF